MKKKSYEEQMDSSYLAYPKIVDINKKMPKKWGKGTMVLPSPQEIRDVIRLVPEGKLITTTQIADILAKQHKTTMACPYTIGILINIVAHATEETGDPETPWWRSLGACGELKPKYPDAYKSQRQLLETEGFEILQKGRKNIKYVVKNYTNYLYSG